MTQVAKLFNNGRSQAVRLPAAYRFEGTEVYIRKDPDTGDVILSPRPESWDGLLEAIKAGGVPDDFLAPGERDHAQGSRDPLDGVPE